jgi:plasmid stability protein
MNGMQLIDMSRAGVNVRDMSKMIQIRNVPDEMHRELKMRAAAAGMSLSDYIKRELGQLTDRRMSMAEIDARLQALGPSRMTTKQVVETIREGRGE